MTTLNDRPESVLLVIDVQTGVVAEANERDEIIRTISRLVDKARLESVPVLWVRHSDEHLVRDDDDWQIVSALVPRPDESIVDKRYGDAFEETSLESHLADLKVGHLVIVGAETDACIRSTLHGAFVRGYDVTLVSDAHTTSDYSEWGGIPPVQVIAHTNLYWEQTSAPGRQALTVKAEELEFGALI